MNIQKECFAVSSIADGLELHAVEIRNREETPRGVVVLVHGMCEHKERYFPFMEYLASLNYASLIYDQRGHGESIRAQEDLGYLYGDGASGLTEDVHGMVLEAKKRFPDLPVHLFGHSMGSLVVRNYLAKYDEEISSLTISGCVAKNPAAGAGKLMAGLVGKIRGQHHRSMLITKMAFGNYTKGIRDPKSFNAWLNTDEKAVEAYDADPLCGFIFTCNGYASLMELILRCYDEKRYIRSHKDLPILFLSGAEDPCCAGEKGFYQAVDFLKGLGYTNVTGIMIPKMRHEILNEPEHEKVYALIAAQLGAAG